MYVLENPVLQRELLVNLRMSRAFLLLLAYQVLLGVVVYVAWPTETRLDLTTNPEAARRLGQPSQRKPMADRNARASTM